MDEETLNKLIEEVREIKERLVAVEKEQRMICEDILSGQAMERMHRRLLNTKYENIIEKNENIEI